MKMLAKVFVLTLSIALPVLVASGAEASSKVKAKRAPAQQHYCDFSGSTATCY